MITNRIIYALTLVAAFFFYILYPPWISWYLLVLLLLLLPFDLIISLPGMLSKGILLSVPYYLNKGDDAALILTTTHTKSFPVGCIIVKMYVTGDDFSIKCRLKCTGGKDEQREVAIDTSHSGITTFEVRRFWSISLLGLFSLPVNINTRASVLVLPEPEKPANTIALQHGILLRPKPGGGFSEEHDMRIYQPGDPVRNIHWKVSAKLENLIIREPLVPPPHSRLVHIVEWTNAAERDAILGRLRWVCEYMLKWQMPFYMKMGDKVMIVEISQEEDLVDYLHSVLDSSVVKKPKFEPLPSRFSWVYRVDASIDTRADLKKREGA